MRFSLLMGDRRISKLWQRETVFLPKKFLNTSKFFALKDNYLNFSTKQMD